MRIGSGEINLYVMRLVKYYNEFNWLYVTIRRRYFKEKMVIEGSMSAFLRLDSPSPKTLQETLDGGFSNPLEQCRWERMGQEII